MAHCTGAPYTRANLASTFKSFSRFAGEGHYERDIDVAIRARFAAP